jgi:hypothetical protein
MGIDPMNNISIIIRILFAVTIFQQRLPSTYQQRRFRDFKHKCYKDDEDYPLLVIKPTKYLLD